MFYERQMYQTAYAGQFSYSYRSRRLGESVTRLNDLSLIGGYPSTIPGVLIFDAEEQYMGNDLLGLTDGRSIVLRHYTSHSEFSVPEFKHFVLLHEEEHVKDMDASELSVDQRALQRFLLTRPSSRAHAAVCALLERRWGKQSWFLGELHGKDLL